MRTTMTISLPQDMAKDIKKEVKKGSYISSSEFFRDLVRKWKEDVLYTELTESKKEFESGKGFVKADSLKEALDKHEK
jgi:Arc/MetJ-type ribon-helix-helix transcriptional regulator